MDSEIRAFNLGTLYSNEEIYKALRIGNAGGVRTSIDDDGNVNHVALLTSFGTSRQLDENPYHDRLEGDVLVYTGAGKEGDQVVSGPNARITQQLQNRFPIFGFVQTHSRRVKSTGNKRWQFIGLLEYLRGYREQQIDSAGKPRIAWMFELRTHHPQSPVDVESAQKFMSRLLVGSVGPDQIADREVVSNSPSDGAGVIDISVLEPIRRKLLSYEPRQFEIVIHDLLKHTGFVDVLVTRYSQDGGIDVNAKPSPLAWPIRRLSIQLQAKRWLHTVGRKEVAELRGSLQPHAAGCIVTTSHFSRAAIGEASETGKVPITLIDGYELAGIVMGSSLLLQ